jgi:PqqD family protein of HPr-rel-A system
VRFRLAEGARVEDLCAAWVAFSPLSGETLQLNTEAAAILELLDRSPMGVDSICEALASDSQTDLAAVTGAVHHVWEQLLLAGLVQIDSGPDHNSG